MEQSPEERKKFLAELNETAHYTATILHGEEVTKVRVRQIKKYFNKTYKLLHRLANLKGEINNNSFKYGYGGKILVRRVMLDLGIIERKKTTLKKAAYTLLIPQEDCTLELVSRIIVEVYLIRHDVQPL